VPPIAKFMPKPLKNIYYVIYQIVTKIYRIAYKINDSYLNQFYRHNGPLSEFF
jgi:hypothetical protein